jgi:hypothetical protein
MDLLSYLRHEAAIFPRNQMHPFCFAGSDGWTWRH